MSTFTKRRLLWLAEISPLTKRRFLCLGALLATVLIILSTLKGDLYKSETVCILATNTTHVSNMRTKSSLWKTFVSSSAALRFLTGDTAVSMDDLELIHYIRNRINGPATSGRKRNITNHVTYHSQAGQAQLVDQQLRQLRDGFFVECGAADGKALSNSLFFEERRNWTGLLIEADPVQFAQLLNKQRKAYSLHACLSPSIHPAVRHFRPVGMLGGIEDTMEEAHLHAIRTLSTQHVAVQCFPLYSVMRALSRDHIHYLSLDVEGAEVDILRTIPWRKLRIDFLTIEYRQHNGAGTNATASRMKLDRIRRLMGNTGLYEEVAILPPTGKHVGKRAVDSYGLDVAFKRIISNSS